MKVVTNRKGKKILWRTGDLPTEDGLITEADVKKGVITTKKKTTWFAFDASFVDAVEQCKTGPATISAKDVGTILARTGLNKKSRVVDAGTGSGILAAYLGNITDDVTTYEKRKEHYTLAKSNLKKLRSPVIAKCADITKGIAEKKVDVIILDLPAPWDVFSHVETSLKSGGYCVCYVPNMTQVQEIVLQAKNHPFLVQDIIETMERQWTIKGRVCRPEHDSLGHTAFLIFIRKY